MKKAVLFLTILACVFCLAGCPGKSGRPDIPELSAITRQGLTQEDCREVLTGQSRDAVIQAWGQPDGTLFGFFGDVWELDDESRQILILYYGEDSFVNDVRITEKKG